MIRAGESPRVARQGLQAGETSRCHTEPVSQTAPLVGLHHRALPRLIPRTRTDHLWGPLEYALRAGEEASWPPRAGARKQKVLPAAAQSAPPQGSGPFSTDCAPGSDPDVAANDPLAS